MLILKHFKVSLINSSKFTVINITSSVACAIVNPLAEDEEEEDGNVEAVKQSSQEEQVK